MSIVSVAKNTRHLHENLKVHEVSQTQQASNGLILETTRSVRDCMEANVPENVTIL